MKTKVYFIKCKISLSLSLDQQALAFTFNMRSDASPSRQTLNIR